MQKTIFLFAISFLIFSCNNQSPKEETTDDVSKEQSSEEAKIGRNNYAIIWKWTTTDTQLVTDNSPAMSKELTELWQNDIVENAYYDADSPVDKFGHFPNIAFFLKAHTIAEVKSILDKLTVVQEKIASYEIHPVGQLWLDRKTEAIKEKGMTNSYVAIWTTTETPLESVNADKLVQEQHDKVLELWNNGVLENVYFDIEGTYETNEKTDFVFFVNADSKEAAEAICNSLPFSRENAATYEMLQAGVFWMGKYQNK